VAPPAAGRLRARLEALQARIRPHFLFNSLNSIASLIASDPERAELAVLDLSDLFRASLAKPGSLVAWRDELALARRYLSIEQYRLGARLELDWQVEGVPDDLPIPQLTLQPLLENAILHGIQPRVEGGRVEVRARYVDGLFELCVSNPYDAELAPASAARARRWATSMRGSWHFSGRRPLLVVSAVTDGTTAVYAILVRDPCRKPEHECPDR